MFPGIIRPCIDEKPCPRYVIFVSVWDDVFHRRSATLDTHLVSNQVHIVSAEVPTLAVPRDVSSLPGLLASCLDDPRSACTSER